MKYVVPYGGWLVVEAADPEVAFKMAHNALCDQRIVCDGENGDWEVEDGIYALGKEAH